ncbi:MAG: hypothetical protein JWP89_1116 [Schlesneria sp.]|nr:hypothetical protein [Schlesneria sp.]
MPSQHQNQQLWQSGTRPHQAFLPNRAEVVSCRHSIPRSQSRQEIGRKSMCERPQLTFAQGLGDPGDKSVTRPGAVVSFTSSKSCASVSIVAPTSHSWFCQMFFHRLALSPCPSASCFDMRTISNDIRPGSWRPWRQQNRRSVGCVMRLRETMTNSINLADIRNCAELKDFPPELSNRLSLKRLFVRNT